MADYINPQLLDAIEFTESGGNPQAVSPVGARGLYQFLPIGWKDVKQNYPELKDYDYETFVTDPRISRIFAQKLLELNSRRLKGKASLENVLGSYNWGIGNVMKQGIEKAPKETRDYIIKVKKKYEENLKKSKVNSLKIYGIK